MYRVLVAGAGKIGSLIACLLENSGSYDVHLADMDFSGEDVRRLMALNLNIKTVALDVKDEAAFASYLAKHQMNAVISSLPYFLNAHVARAAKHAHAHYFDLTEDTKTTAEIKAIANDAKSAFVPQCGLAPGFVSIVASSLMQKFDECHEAKLRVGALPMHSSHALQYALTWSTDGLINEYGNLCHAIEHGRDVLLAPLEGLEQIQIDGCAYEAFNTSGGLGSLGEVYQNKVQHLNYKTIRYPGHCDKIRFLMNDLGLNHDRATLKKVLERSLPKTYQDVVIVYTSVAGYKGGVLHEESFVKKIYPQTISGLLWSAIQVATASGVCAVVDRILGQSNEYRGLVLQESFGLDDFMANRFGQYYA